MFISADGALKVVEIAGDNCTVDGMYWGRPCKNYTSEFVYYLHLIIRKRIREFHNCFF